MASSLKSKFRFDSHEKLTASQLGESWGDGFFVQELGKKTPTALTEEEREQAKPVSVNRQKTVAEREDMPRDMANRLMMYYTDNLNNPSIINPIRDGVPQCARHRFPPGCYHGCQSGVLPRHYGPSLAEVFEWVQGLIRVNYKKWLDSRPELRGWR